MISAIWLKSSLRMEFFIRLIISMPQSNQRGNFTMSSYVEMKTHRSRRVPFPFCQITLKAKKPLKDWCSRSLYRQRLKSVGSCILRKRLKSGISQASLTKRFNVKVETIQNWEHSRTIPDICRLPRIIEFLGYDPLEIGEKID